MVFSFATVHSAVHVLFEITLNMQVNSIGKRAFCFVWNTREIYGHSLLIGGILQTERERLLEKLPCCLPA
jgi:hypothetical protein